MIKLKQELKEYIDSGNGKDKLRETLLLTSPENRFNVLKTVKGLDGTWTGLHRAARENHFELIASMMDGFAAADKYYLVQMQKKDGKTGLHFVATNGNTSMLSYLVDGFSLEQKHDLFSQKDKDEGTALHNAASEYHGETVNFMLSSVSSHLLKELLKIKNKDGQTVTDIRPELHDEVPLLISEGMKVPGFVPVLCQAV